MRPAWAAYRVALLMPFVAFGLVSISKHVGLRQPDEIVVSESYSLVHELGLLSGGRTPTALAEVRGGREIRRTHVMRCRDLREPAPAFTRLSRRPSRE